MLLAVVAIAGNAMAQPQPPTLLCADIQPNDNVVLTWDIPPGAQSDYLYRIYRDTGNGFVQLVDNLSFTTTTFTDNSVDPTDASIKYRMQTYNSGSSAFGNTISTLFLSLLPSGSSIAQLSWNSPYDTQPTVGQYIVHRNVESTGFVEVATVPVSTNTYSDTLFGLCDLTDINLQFVVDYKVSYQRPECEMFSQQETGEFRDVLGPGLVDVETVTINPLTGIPEIYWYPITGVPDLKNYTIRAYVGGQETSVGVVPAFQQTFFVYNDADLNSATTFQMIAKDSCDVESGFVDEYTTMWAYSDYEDCSQNIELAWTPYFGWEEGVAEQNIYVNENNGGFQLVATVSPDELMYNLAIEPNSEYCIYIEAVSNGSQRPSTTNATCVETNYPEVIDFNYLNRVTTVSEDRIQIDLLQDLQGIGTTYELMRAEGDDDFQSIGVYSATNDPVFTVFDTDVNTSNTVYKYKWKAFDGCGEELAESNTGKNMVLDVITTSENLINSLNWTNYSTWDGGVSEYQVFRKLGSETNYSLLTTLGPGTFSYEEDIESFLLEEGEFCYKIVAIEGANQYSSETTSESNETCVTQEPLIWIPNTIVLNGFNKVFKPVAGFIDFQSFEMEIYNKWGQKIFSSSDISDGWDGTHNGNVVREDYYRYIIVFRDGSGKSYLEQGVVYVLVDS